MFYKPQAPKKRKLGNLVMFITFILYIAMVPVATGVAIDAVVKRKQVPEWADALSLPAAGFYGIALAVIPSTTPGTVFMVLYFLMALPLIFMILGMLLAAAKKPKPAAALGLVAGLLFLPAGALAIIAAALYVKEDEKRVEPPTPMLTGPW